MSINNGLISKKSECQIKSKKINKIRADQVKLGENIRLIQVKSQKDKSPLKCQKTLIKCQIKLGQMTSSHIKSGQIRVTL